jgi:hypothetical protein
VRDTFIFRNLFLLFCVGANQGDLIGRKFAQCAIVDFGQLFENEQSSLLFWATFPHRYGFVIILRKKTNWTTFWAIFSQTLLVTLAANDHFFLRTHVTERKSIFWRENFRQLRLDIFSTIP